MEQSFIAKRANCYSSNGNDVGYISDDDEDNNAKPASGATRNRFRNPGSSGSKPFGLNNLDRGLFQEEINLIRQAGGTEFLNTIASQCETEVENGTTTIQPNDMTGDTVIMEKALQKPHTVHIQSDIAFWRRNHSQILAYSKIIARKNPELLAHRNKQVRILFFYFCWFQLGCTAK